MNFRVKALLQSIFSVLPGSENLNYLAQKYITKSLPASRERYREIFDHAKMHSCVFEKYGCAKTFEDNTAPTVYEIGCGWDLAMALIFSSFGYRSIIALDTVRHVRPELINTIIRYMAQDGLPAAAGEYDASFDINAMLRSDFGIIYKAPCNSANTGLEDGSVDYIYSHLVFEHIPPDMLPSIMNECLRVLKEDGVISLVIDYADHYRTFDKKITPYNFLRYSDRSWKKYNPALHYVNRLRHKDFIDIFNRAGFDVVEETVFKPDNAEDIIHDFPFADEFASKYTHEELSITHAHIVLKKRHQ